MSADREFLAIEEEAAHWMVEHDRGLSRDREREFSRWLDADPRHAAAFHALEETWNLMGEARPGLEESGRPATGWRGRRRWLPASLAVAAALAFTAVGRWRTNEARLFAEPFALASTTEVGTLRSLPLPDGSIIQLNTDSTVDVHFTALERRVTLARGEAHFTVAKDRDRPFIVSVAGVDVRVVGTVFNVRLRPDAVDVLVTQGKVRVDPEATATSRTATSREEFRLSELTAGQKLSIDLHRQTAPVVTRAELSPAKIKQALAWQSRRLDFEATPLEEIVNEMNRYNRHTLVIADPALNAQRFGGSFPAGDYETIVRMLEANFGVIAERRENETRLRLKSPLP